MKILSIDTSCERLTVIADTGEKLFVKASGGGLKKHNALVLEYIDAVSKTSGTELSDFDAFGAVVGPGSFTGVRVGTATLNAFATALSKPLVAVTSFECAITDASDKTVLVDAGHGCFYYGIFENGELKSKGYAEPAEIAEFSDKLIKTETSPEAFALAVRKKFARGETADQLEPLYLRKSQAEREADESRN